MSIEAVDMQVALTTLLNALPDGVLLVTSDHTIAFANTAAYQLLRYPQGTLGGVDLGLLPPQRYRARHAEQLTGFVEQSGARLMSRRPVLYALTADAREIPVSIVISTLEIDGQTYAQ